MGKIPHRLCQQTVLHRKESSGGTGRDIELGVDVHINKTILLNPIVECCNLLSSCVFLIISSNNIRIAYKIKELGTLYLNLY